MTKSRRKAVKKTVHRPAKKTAVKSKRTQRRNNSNEVLYFKLTPVKRGK